MSRNRRSGGGGTPRSDQGEAWAEVGDLLACKGAASDTDAMAAAFEQRRGDIEAVMRAFPYPAEAVGTELQVSSALRFAPGRLRTITAEAVAFVVRRGRQEASHFWFLGCPARQGKHLSAPVLCRLTALSGHSPVPGVAQPCSQSNALTNLRYAEARALDLLAG